MTLSACPSSFGVLRQSRAKVLTDGQHASALRLPTSGTRSNQLCSSGEVFSRRFRYRAPVTACRNAHFRRSTEAPLSGCVLKIVPPFRPFPDLAARLLTRADEQQPERLEGMVLGSRSTRYGNWEISDRLRLGRRWVLLAIGERLYPLRQPIFEGIDGDHAIAREVGLT
jgi:hypothetical protein